MLDVPEVGGGVGARIADLAGAERIETADLAEVMQYSSQGGRCERLGAEAG